jgi:hypothetical protein
MTNISEIEDIDAATAATLKAAGITTTEAFLDQAGTVEGRKQLAAATGIEASVILKWANHADLFRLKGVAEQYADLLEAAGVDTVVELSKRVPENLTKKLEEINTAKSLVQRVPTLTMVTGWVEEAKTMDRKIHY